MHSLEDLVRFAFEAAKENGIDFFDGSWYAIGIAVDMSTYDSEISDYIAEHPSEFERLESIIQKYLDDHNV